MIARLHLAVRAPFGAPLSNLFASPTSEAAWSHGALAWREAPRASTPGESLYAARMLRPSCAFVAIDAARGIYIPAVHA